MVLRGQQRGERRELCEVAGERVEEADMVAVVEKNKKALGGDCEQLMVMELCYADLYTLAGGCVEEAAAFRRHEFVPEHGPPPGMEPAVQTTMGAWVNRATSPWAANGTEAEVVGNIIGKDELSNQPQRAIVKISPVPPVIIRKSRAAAGLCGARALRPPMTGGLAGARAPEEPLTFLWLRSQMAGLDLDLDLRAGGRKWK